VAAAVDPAAALEVVAQGLVLVLAARVQEREVQVAQAPEQVAPERAQAPQAQARARPALGRPVAVVRDLTRAVVA
jgi:hypothetical protein